MQLAAAEPLVQQPSGVCWDAKGWLFVSELHGFNLEGQFDVVELNKPGKVDTEVSRIAAPPLAKARAAATTFGTIKLRSGAAGAGVMDRATVFADRLQRPAAGRLPTASSRMTVRSNSSAGMRVSPHSGATAMHPRSPARKRTVMRRQARFPG